jgi:hypothetical protein
MLNRFIDNNELEISLDDDILTIEEEKESWYGFFFFV